MVSRRGAPSSRAVNRLAENGNHCTIVIALGKCLEFYSKCYPRVIRDGQIVSVEEAVENMRLIADALAAMELPADMGGEGYSCPSRSRGYS